MATALDEIERLSASARSALQQWHMTSAVEGRLVALVDGGLVAIAVVIIDHDDADLRVDDHGLIALPDIQDGPWNAAQFTDTAGTHLAALLAADAPPVPVSPAPDSEDWAAGMNEDGSVPEQDAPVDVTAERVERAVGPEAIRRLAIVQHQDPHLDRDLEL